MTWPAVKLGEVCLVKRGTTITEKNASSGMFPVVAGGMTYSYTHNIANRKGNVITISGSGANAGYVNYWGEPIFASDCSTVEVDNNNIDIKYVYFFLKKMQIFINCTMRSGAAQPHVYAKDIALMEMPLPPLAEQQRIAAILDKAEEIRRKREQAIEKLDQLAQSTFVEMFGDFNKRITYPQTEFGNIVNETKLGLVRGAAELAPNKKVPYLRMNAIIKNAELQFEKLMYADATESEIHDYHLLKDDFLFNTRNSKELVGKTAIFSADGIYIYNNNIMRIRFTNDTNPIYIAYAFQTSYVQHALDQLKSGTTNVYAIYYKDLKKLQIPLPPKNKQDLFEKKLKGVKHLKNKMVKDAIVQDHFLSSLQYQAFTTGFNA